MDDSDISDMNKSHIAGTSEYVCYITVIQSVFYSSDVTPE